MAYNSANLFCASGTTGSAPRLWVYYSADDALAAIAAADYFNAAYTQLNAGDVVFIRDSTGAMAISYVLTKAAGSIDLVDGLAIPNTNTP